MKIGSYSLGGRPGELAATWRWWQSVLGYAPKELLNASILLALEIAWLPVKAGGIFCHALELSQTQLFFRREVRHDSEIVSWFYTFDDMLGWRYLAEMNRSRRQSCRSFGAICGQATSTCQYLRLLENIHNYHPYLSTSQVHGGRCRCTPGLRAILSTPFNLH